MNSLKNFHFKEMSFISQNLSFSHEHQQVATIEEIRKILQIDKVIATSFLMQKYSLIAKTSMFQWILHHNASEINFIYIAYISLQIHMSKCSKKIIKIQVTVTVRVNQMLASWLTKMKEEKRTALSTSYDNDRQHACKQSCPLHEMLTTVLSLVVNEWCQSLKVIHKKRGIYIHIISKTKNDKSLILL